MRPAGFVIVMALTAATAIAAVCAVNLATDPYYLFGLVRIAGFNQHKSQAGERIQMAKAYLVARAHPHTLLIGNSRVEIGFDPQSPAWSATGRPIFNLGVPGATMLVQRLYLEHALRRARPQTVIIGLDFTDFLLRPDIASDVTPSEYRLLAPGDRRRSALWRDMVQGTLSLDTLWASMLTVAHQRDPWAPDMTEAGYNPLREYAAFAREEGYFGLFSQKYGELVRRYAALPKTIDPPDDSLSIPMAQFRAMLEACISRGVKVILFVHPYHADMLEILDAVGMWPAFEEWKRAMAAAAAEFSRPGYPIALWDFSGYHRWATETVPPPGDTSTTMRWYWEPAHYKASLGALMIARMFGGGDTAFGCQMEPSTVDHCIELVRQQREDFHRQYPNAAARLRPFLLQYKNFGSNDTQQTPLVVDHKSTN